MTMIIDIHTHIFPDKIAEAVLAYLEAEIGLPGRALGTENDLRDHIAGSGTDLAVVLGVATEARLVKKTNDWLLAKRDDRFQLFGAIHPDFEDWPQELERLKKEGVRGIKINCLTQKIRPDDPKMYPIYEKAASEGLVILFHAGGSFKNRGNPGEVLGSPERIAKVLDAFPGMKVIAAHFGGNQVLEQMKIHLLGREVYFDTSYPPDLWNLAPEEVLSIIRAHGVDRMLFGTDYPWETQTRCLQYIRSLPLTEEEKQKILGENARRLLS